MEYPRLAVMVTVGVIVGVALASGPLVGAVDLTRTPTEQEEIGVTGNATVTVQSLPEMATLDRGEYGAGAYYLELPDASIRLEEVTGNPLIVYRIRIPDLGFVREMTYFVDTTNEGRMTLTQDRIAIEPDQVTRESYPGEVGVAVRSGTSNRRVATKNITVTVNT